LLSPDEKDQQSQSLCEPREDKDQKYSRKCALAIHINFSFLSILNLKFNASNIAFVLYCNLPSLNALNSTFFVVKRFQKQPLSTSLLDEI